MKQLRELKILLSCLAVIFLCLTAGEGLNETVRAQGFEDFEDLGIDKDFFFGGKEEVKRDNIDQANEANREDIAIEEKDRQDAANTTTTTTVTVQFSIAELPIASPNGTDKLQVEVVGVSPVLVTNLDGASVTRSVNLVPGSTHTLKITCIAALSISCDSDISILSGATFKPPTSPSTTGAQMPAPGTPITHTFTVNAA